MPATPFQGLLDRIGQLNQDIDEVLAQGHTGSVGHTTYAMLYNSMRKEAEELAGKTPPLPQVPTTASASESVGVLIALKALTSQLKIWLRQNPPGS